MYTKIGDLNIYYQKAGYGKDLIMLHGWGLDSSSFWPDVDLLKDTFTLWLLDLPGHGRSDTPSKTFTITDYKNIIEQFIKRQKIKKPAVLGHSFGGRIAIKLASASPQLLEKIILEDSAGISAKSGVKNTLFQIIAKLVKYLIPNIFNLKELLKIKVYKILKSDYKDTGALKETFKKSIREDLTEDLKKIPLEALIIWGEKDKTTPLKDGKSMYQLIKNSKLLVMEETGHASHITDPERFSYYVKDFA